MSEQKRETCKDRVRGAYRSRMGEVRKLWSLYKRDPEGSTPEGEQWQEYGLAFDYVPRGTFDNQKRSFFRFQISTGGPGEEFRFYADETLSLTAIEFWYLDWSDGAKVRVGGRARETWEEIWEDWRQCGVQEGAMRKEREG